MEYLEHLKNFRDFSSYRKKNGAFLKAGIFARSDNPCNITPSEISLLRHRGFGTDIDLRRINELAERPDLLARTEGFNYHQIIMNDDTYYVYGDVLEPPGIAAAYYSRLLGSADRIVKVFRIMAEAEGGVLFHCESGKDRTGTIAALLLLLLDVCEEDIVEDYRLSYDRMYLTGDPLVLADPNLIPQAESMRLFLAMFRQDYAVADKYFRKIGLFDSEIAAIRNKYKE